MLSEACAGETKDIVWLNRFDDGLVQARATCRPVVLKPLGQGVDDFAGWCPAGAHTRAVGFSHTRVARLIQDAFVPVLISMHVTGPCADEAGRKFVSSQANVSPI